ncbi:MAG: hypothetical protein EAX86_13430 [Candidatus Heimdallarchaeota archaeon]|nr:hypothetical protein [Candidatus Heimdallarchaeota archaeon]
MNSLISDLIIHPQVRPQQDRSFTLIQENWPRFHSFFCSLPTGSGKTDLAACILTDYLKNNSSAKIDILVPYKMHQDFWNEILQRYARKHGFSVSLLKGRGSYYCPIIKSGANISPCAFDPLYAQTCSARHRCALLKARRDIRKSQVRILNWWVFKYVDLGDDKATFRIFDEAHNLLNLEHLLRVEIKKNLIKKLTSDPELLNQFQSWETEELGDKYYFEIPQESGLEYVDKLQGALAAYETEMAKLLNENPVAANHDNLRELRRSSEMILALSELIENPVSSDLAFFFQRDGESRSTKLVLQPFDLAFIFSKLFRGSKNLFLSATIGDGEYLANLIGLSPQHCHFIHEVSSFNKDLHPFILLKEAERLSTSKDRKKNAFDYIQKNSRKLLELTKKLNLRSLILSSSFELARLMETTAKSLGLMVITHTSGKSDGAIKRFITEREGDVLITPSGWEGISLDDDLARVCIIPKVPFPMMGDPIVRKKAAKYPDFLEKAVLISIQQAHGRIQRNEYDWGVTYCLDGNFRWLNQKNMKSLEAWFRERIHEKSEEEVLQIVNKLNASISKPRQYNLSNVNINSDFSKMKTKDREWLESSGLMDLLRKD